MLDGIAITAMGLNGGNLFGKKSGSDETGLGLTGNPTGDHEIFAKKSGAQGFIQLDLLGLITAGFTDVKFQMGSSEGGDQWQVTACSTAGVSGSGPCAANASTLIGTDGTLNLAPKNCRLWIRQAFRSLLRMPFSWSAYSVSRASHWPSDWRRKKLSRS